jgi:hypothetical protein
LPAADYGIVLENAAGLAIDIQPDFVVLERVVIHFHIDRIANLQGISTYAIAVSRSLQDVIADDDVSSATRNSA